MMKKDISANLNQKYLILCSKILLNVLYNLSLTVLLPWQHTGFQTSPTLKAFLATFGVPFSKFDHSGTLSFLRSINPRGVLPYKGLMGTCGQPGYVFQDFCLKQGIEFIIFCLNQGIDLSIFVLNRMSFLGR